MIHLVGMGDDGPDGLSSAARQALEQAEIIIGGARLLSLLGPLQAETLSWPRPFAQARALLQQNAARKMVVLVTGDPLWFSGGSLVLEMFGPDQIQIHPHPSGFQWAASRMGWSLEHVICDTIHGRPITRLAPLITPGRHLLLLAAGKESAPAFCNWLTEQGYGASEVTALAHIGGVEERRIEGVAHSWSATPPDFHILAVRCASDGSQLPLGRMPGLSSTQYIHDGQITRPEIRALTLALLRPIPGALLWDIGCGSASIAIEWMRAAPQAQAVAIDRNTERLFNARQNADRLGADRLELVEGDAAQIFGRAESPDAIFFGGGMSPELIGEAVARLAPNGRLVANAVTIESEQMLAQAHARHGGELRRIALQHLTPIGGRNGWKAAMPVTQWSFVK